MQVKTVQAEQILVNFEMILRQPRGMQMPCFCVDDGKHQAKMRHLASLLSNHDAVAVQEAHCTAGLCLSWRPPRGSRGFVPLVWMQIHLELA